MTHKEGERRVKSLQKEFLGWIETEQCLFPMESAEFNAIRRRVIRTTFDAFRFGVVGLGTLNEEILWRYFFVWVELKGLPQDAVLEVMQKCFMITLEAFRVGAVVSACRGNHAVYNN
jgi:hypothetical protein